MKNLRSLASIAVAASVVLCVRPAAAGYTLAELRANPNLPVFSSFYAAPEFRPERLLTMPTSVIAPNVSAAPVPSAPSAVTRGNQEARAADVAPAQIPALAPAAGAQTRENFEAALAALQGRSPLTGPQSSAVSTVAQQAFEAHDVDTLTRLALLTSRERERAVQNLIIRTLHVLRDRVSTPESVEAVIALRTLSNSIPSDEARAWMAAQVKDRVAAAYLAPPPAPSKED